MEPVPPIEPLAVLLFCRKKSGLSASRLVFTVNGPSTKNWPSSRVAPVPRVMAEVGEKVKEALASALRLPLGQIRPVVAEDGQELLVHTSRSISGDQSSRSDSGRRVPHHGQNRIRQEDEPPSWMINPYSRS